jgi:predicted alpha/beta superfamily hydrolase
VTRSAVHRFQSKIVDDVYELRISVPEDYEDNEELRPVIYVLDGQWNFTLVSDIVGKLAFDGLMPQAVVVGITWADSSFQPAEERWRDFAPDPNANIPGSGGAANFLQVLETEVFPLVQSNYRASTERVLTGGSLSGLFVSYALLERPDLFLGYISSSGATGQASQYFTRRLAEVTPELLAKERAYFSVGALYDNETEVRRFVGELEAILGDTPEIVLDVVPGVGHTGNEPFAYTRGLAHAFQRPRLALSEPFLEQYEGDYFEPSIPELPDLTIEAGNGELYILQDGESWGLTLYAASTTDFYAEGTNVSLSFSPDRGRQASLHPAPRPRPLRASAALSCAQDELRPADTANAKAGSRQLPAFLRSRLFFPRVFGCLPSSPTSRRTSRRHSCTPRR